MPKRSIKRRVPRRKRISIEAILLSLAVLLIALWPSLVGVRLAHQGELKIWFFDVGQGDATLIETPNGRQLLIDGGPDDRVLSKLSSVMLPWDQHLDAVIVTHPDADHITGLVSVLDRYRVEEVYETGVEGFTPISDALSKRIQQEVPSSKQLLAGSVLEIDGVTIRALWPTPRVLEGQEEKNNTSIVLELIYGETSVLLTGDAEERVELAILSDVQDVDVLKLGHHGSKTSSVYPFLQRTQPEYAIASSGEGNKFGHPHGIVLSRLREIGAEVFVTGRDGDILLTSEGNEPIVAVFPLPF